jgi:putative SOS response-associated peptidase YedK
MRSNGRRLLPSRPGALSDLQQRAPVVLRQESWARWLDLIADAHDLLMAEPPDFYRVWPFHEIGVAI